MVEVLEISAAHVLGMDSSYIDFQSYEVPVHRAIVDDVSSLKSAARSAGFELGLASGYRSYERQLSIWNAKATGKRSLCSDNGELLDINRRTHEEVLFAILRWSALPGASRHHWGTDLDVYDVSALADESSLQLTIAECEGPFKAFYDWLDEYLGSPSSPFFRPYSRDSGGVAREPWHLSHKKIAAFYKEKLCLDMLKESLQDSPCELKQVALQNMEKIFKNYVLVYKEY